MSTLTQTDKHINTIARPGVEAGPGEKQVSINKEPKKIPRKRSRKQKAENKVLYSSGNLMTNKEQIKLSKKMSARKQGEEHTEREKLSLRKQTDKRGIQ